jgi:hypothetical protein
MTIDIHVFDMCGPVAGKNDVLSRPHNTHSLEMMVYTVYYIRSEKHPEHGAHFSFVNCSHLPKLVPFFHPC